MNSIWRLTFNTMIWTLFIWGVLSLKVRPKEPNVVTCLLQGECRSQSLETVVTASSVVNFQVAAASTFNAMMQNLFANVYVGDTHLRKGEARR